MTFVSVRAAAQHIARTGTVTPHQMASLARLDERLKEHPDILREFTEGWRAKGSPAAPAGVNVMDGLMPLLDLIAKGEGNYNSINRGRAGDTPGGYPGLDRMTIGEVQALQRGGYFAVGRYQFIPETLNIAVRDAGMNQADLFNPEGQDMLAAALLLGGKRPLLRDYLQGSSEVSLEAAQLELSKEWASIPMANGKGFYDGDKAGNRASAKVAEVQQALQQARAALGGKTLPQLRLPAQQAARPVKMPPHLTLRRTKTRVTTPAGLEVLELSRVVDGIVLDKLPVTSGAPGRQRFETGARSQAGGLTPLPEGRYRIGPVEWAGGKGNWAKAWPDPGLGPVWIGIEYEAPGRTARSALGFHLDANIATAPGSAGCVVLATRKDLETLIRWLEGSSIKQMFVDWGLKTCPPVRPV